MKHSRFYFVFLLVIMSGLKMYGYKNYDIKVKNEDGVTIYYYYINDNKELSVTFCGDYDNRYGWRFDDVYEGDVKIPNEVEINDQKLKVTSIGQWTFKNSKKISLYIPDNLKVISPMAFDNATIEAVYISDFKVWCNIDFNGGNPFLLANKVYVNGEEFTLGSRITIPNGINRVGNRAFANTRILSVKIPDSVTQIGDSAFCDCERLMEVDLGHSIVKINNFAFANCSALENIVLPETVEHIGWYSFYQCHDLKSINLPLSLKDIGSWAFSGCNNLSCPIEISNFISTIKEGTFGGCSNISSIKLGNSLEKIEEGAFGDCQNLSEIELPTSLKEIGKRAFAYCMNISSIEIPRNVNTIETGAFKECNKLSSIKFCGSVKKIGSGAFEDLYNFDKIYISCSEDPYDADDYAFDISGYNTKLLVPFGTKKIYEVTKGWKKFKKIEESELASGLKDIKTVNEIETYYKLNGAVSKPETKKGILIEKYKNGRTRKIIKQ